jgi:predicted kinase
VLVIMSGLPGVGKSAIADELGRLLPACVISVDPIEAAMLACGIPRSFETGLAAYNVGAAIASHQLRLGMSAIADAANYLEVGRRIWTAAAAAAGVAALPVEVVCSDEALHRDRLERRRRDLEPYPDLTWETVRRRRRAAEPWTSDRLVLDSVRSVDENVAEALEFLRKGAAG